MSESPSYRGKPTFYAPDPAAWRQWLEANHQGQQGVWLIIYKKESGIHSVYYPEAVDEALCFGWVDSLGNKRDEQSYYQYFSPRKPKSNWSGVNKAKVERLLAAGKMMPAGMEMVELAKRTGTWTALEEVENGVVPADLEAALALQPQALAHWQAFPPSAKRGILQWLSAAKQAATRERRIVEIVNKAADNRRAFFE